MAANMNTVKRGAAPRITETAGRAPKRDAATKRTEGPFLDTGLDVKRFGRVYLRMAAVKQALRKEGWRTKAEVDKALKEMERKVEQAEKDREDAERFRELAELVGRVLPEPEPVEKQVVVEKTRKITDEDVKRYIERNPDVLRSFRPAPAGSKEEWDRLYREGKPGQSISPDRTIDADGLEVDTTSSAARIPGNEKATRQSTGGEKKQTGPEPAKEIEVEEQTVDLDEVLDNNNPEIEAWLEGKDDETKKALVAREEWRAAQAEKPPRKGVLKAAGVDTEE